MDQNRKKVFSWRIVGLEKGSEPAPCAPCSQFCRRDGPAELSGDMRKTPSFEVMEREEGAIVGRELTEEGFDFIRCAARGGITAGVDGLRLRQVAGCGRGFNRPTSAHDLPAEVVPSGIGGDSKQPMKERLITPPVGQSADHAKKRILDEIVEICACFDESPEQPGHCSLMALHENLHCHPVAIPGSFRAVGVGIDRSAGGNRSIRRLMGSILCIFGFRFQTVRLIRSAVCVYLSSTRGLIAGLSLAL